MKKTLLCSVLALSGIACAQPTVESWMMNNGEYASYWENTATQGNPPNYVFYTTTTPANVTKVCYDATNVYVQSEGMTTEMGKFLNPGAPTAQGYTFMFPQTPQAATTSTDVPLIGAIGLLINGVPMYGLSNAHYYTGSGNTGMGFGTWNVEVYLSEGFVIDTTLGAHPQQQGAYHSHAKPLRLYEYVPSSQHSPIIGYAFDGYPVYGPYGYSDPNDAGSAIARMKSGFSLRNITDRTTLPDGTTLNSSEYGPAINSTYPLGTYVEDYGWSAANGGDLDLHNGRFCVTPEYPSGTYAYFITIDASGTPEFPYLLGTSYYGVVPSEDLQQHPNITIPGTTNCFTAPLGLAENQVETIRTAPNPSNGIFKLTLPDVTGNVTVTITDALGKTVFRKEFSGQECMVDLSPESRGIFQVSVENQGKTSTTKILLQ